MSNVIALIVVNLQGLVTVIVEATAGAVKLVVAP